ncbi:MAG: hypothetical protein NVSMB9_03830 [Isosphaeraceae bacterium]
MLRLAEGLYQLQGFPRNAVNVYVMGGVLVDAGTRFDSNRILRQIRGRGIKAHALTHAHPDHQGGSHVICEALGIPLWCGEADADAVEDPRLMLDRLSRNLLVRRLARFLAGPGHQVSRKLHEGDEVGGFRVVETPGHCAGHLSYWRQADRVLVLGDVLANNRGALWGFSGLCEPPTFFSADPARNRESARKVAALQPLLVCFGHGPPLSDTRAFLNFVDRLAR